MPEFCTCGAQLPPDALFCHKCGKPQRELVVPETVAPVVAPAPLPQLQPRPEPLPVNFHNGVAMRIAILVAAMATLLSFLPFLNWLAAGFFAVFFYRRKTGTLLNVGAGVRMGWITGLLMFGLSSIVFAAQQLPAALSGHLDAKFQEQLKNLAAQDPLSQQMMQFFQTGPGVIVLLLFSLVALFLFTTGLSMAGGALGAKMVGRD
ncbi:conserved membrane hypothetical protein [Candidatus Sulfopaludibacter sp. SbA6]|nr:conserved membrane hypothetical protein [Candidatus Sulfopaludibacter sp. SbA6]